MILTQNSRTWRICAVESGNRNCLAQLEGGGGDAYYIIKNIMFWNLTNYLNYLLFMRFCRSKLGEGNDTEPLKNNHTICRQNCRQKMLNKREIF
jgi:hypothetical protein